MTAGEHLDPESVAPADWEPWDPYDLLALDPGDPADYGLRRVRDLRPAPGLLDYPQPDEWPRNAETCPHGSLAGAPCMDCANGAAMYVDEQRPADFDDEEQRP
jgi:hypothetical protein